MMKRQSTAIVLGILLASQASLATTFTGFGDSITYGFNSSWGDGYLTIYRIYNGWEMPLVNVVNEGYPDETTSEGLARFGSTMSQTGATHVFIMEGTNDVNFGASANSVIANLSQMASIASGMSIVPVVGSPPPRADYDVRDPGNQKAAAIAGGMEGFAAGNGFPFARVFDDLFVQTTNYLQGKVHPNDFGFTIMARSWHNALRPLFGGPTLTAVAPNWGESTVSTTASLTGTGFIPGMQAYLFNMLDTGNEVRDLGNETQQSATSYSVDVPANVPPYVFYDLVIADPGGSGGAILDYGFASTGPPPAPQAVTPSSAPTGQSVNVRIDGTGLGNYASVSFGTSQGTNFAWQASTQATVDSPPLPPGVYDVRYVNDDRSEGVLPAAFASLGPTPSILSISPPNGDTSTSVPIVVTGTNFDPSAKLFLGTTQITPIIVTSATQIDATVPAGLPIGVYDVIVTNPDTQVATLPGGYTSEDPAPVVTSVTPSPVESGTRTTLTIAGSKLKAGATVKAGTTGLVDVTFASAQQITAVTPQSLAPGTYDVIVTNPNGKSGTLASGLTAQDTTSPTVAMSYPASGQTGAPDKPRIDLWIADTGSGVDTSTLSLQIGGSPVSGFTTTGGPKLVHLRYQVSTPFTALQVVPVRVQGADLGALPLDRTITFTVTSTADGDGDGLPTDWENAHALDDTSSTGVFGATGDADHDGATNQAELATGSDPTSRAFLLTAAGPGATNPADTALFLPSGQRMDATLPLPYGGYGLNVGLGDVTADGTKEILTGPGPSPSYGPQVRGYRSDLSPIASLNFFAYGTLKYGAKVSAGSLEGGAREDLVTGPGPGVVFGPQIRGFRWTGALSAISKVSFFAYGTLKYGVNPGSAELDGDGYDEILTGAAGAPVFGPHVRGFNFDNVSVTAMGKVSFYAFGTLKYGVAQTSGDVDADGYDEIVCAPGPGSVFTSQVHGYNFDGQSVASIASINFVAFTGSQYGAKVGSGDLDGDRRSDIVVGYGESPTLGARVRTFRYTGTLTSLDDFYAWDGTGYGVNVAVGDAGLAP